MIVVFQDPPSAICEMTLVDGGCGTTASTEVKALSCERIPRPKIGPEGESNSPTPRMFWGSEDRTGNTNDVCPFGWIICGGSFENIWPCWLCKVKEVLTG